MPSTMHSRFGLRSRLVGLGAAIAIVDVLAFAAAPRAAELLSVGDAFPPWQLTDQNGARVGSQDLAGKTYLLWFYPKASTPGCTMEGQQLRDRFAEFQQRGIEILGVSFDGPADNLAFVEAEKFPFRLLSDRERTLAVAVGAASSPSQPVARRISYVVGPDARVVKVYGDVVPGAHAQQILTDLGGPSHTRGTTPR